METVAQEGFVFWDFSLGPDDKDGDIFGYPRP